MMNFLLRIVPLLICSIFVAHAAELPSGQKPAITAPAPKTSAAAPVQVKPRPIPFHGTLGAVNPSARTITVGKRTFVLTSETKLYREDKNTEGTLKDGVVGGRVTGSYFKAPDGKLLARSIYFKSEPGQAAPSAPPARR